MSRSAEIVLLLSLVGILSFLAKRYAKIISSWMGLGEAIFIGGEFILLGIILGPHGIDLIPHSSLEEIFPLFSLALGWIGLTMMLELDFRMISRVPVSFFKMSFLESVITFLIVFWGIGAFTSLVHFPKPEFIWPMALAAMALPVAPAVVAAQLRRYVVDRQVFQKIITVSILDDFLAVVLYAFVHPYLISRVSGEPFAKIFFISIGIGVASGILLHFLTFTSRRRAEIFLIMLGIVFLTSGISGMLGVSPLLACAISGVVVANTSYKRMRMVDVLQRAEQPIFFAFLILVGAWLNLGILFQQGMAFALFVIAAVFVAFRVIGKLFGSWLAWRLAREQDGKLCFSLIAQGGIYIAILVDLRLSIAGEVSNALLLVGIIAFILNTSIVYPLMRFRYR